MNFLNEDLNRNSHFEKRIISICSFNNAKCNFKQGRILSIQNTNISFIEPHNIEITIKNKKIILIYFDEKNLFLFNRMYPITVKKLDILLKSIKETDS